jgi:sulfur carrier protein ThiS
MGRSECSEQGGNIDNFTFLPADHESYSIGSGLKVRDILQQLGIAEYEVNLVFIDGMPANLDSAIEGGERVMLYPPLGGG